LSASPRGDRSKSLQVARAFLDEYRRRAPDDEISELNVFTVELLEFDGPDVQARYNILHDRESSEDKRETWSRVEAVIADFKEADKYVLSLPMWNCGIPYRLKHYFDVLVQPGYMFSFDPESGYAGLVTGKPVVAVYARGGDYASDEAGHRDLQRPYVETVLGFIGLTDVHSIVIEPTLARGPDLAGERVSQAEAKARELARSF
jgi:FMN-dependent NADH-azoreductase